MKTLNTLVKVQKQKLDTVRRNLASLESQVAQLQALDKTIEKELATEIQLADTSAELSGFFGDYIKRVRERQQRIRQEIRELDVQVEMTREALRAEYSEQLKYEQLLEQKKLAAKKLAARKEDIELDDIAAAQHMRKEDAE